MRKIIISIIVLIVLSAVLYLTILIVRMNVLTMNIENGSYDECFDDDKVESGSASAWDGSAPLRYKFLASGDQSCYGPHYPAIEISFDDATHWIHIVTTTADNQFSGERSSLGTGDDDWVFVDVASQQLRDDGYPFYSTGSFFRDNPSWIALPHKELKWVGEAYAVKLIDDVFYVQGGFSWGFNLKRWSFLPEAIHPEALGRDSWMKLEGELNSAYPDYTFSSEG